MLIVPPWVVVHNNNPEIISIYKSVLEILNCTHISFSRGPTQALTHVVTQQTIYVNIVVVYVCAQTCVRLFVHAAMHTFASVY